MQVSATGGKYIRYGIQLFTSGVALEGLSSIIMGAILASSIAYGAAYEALGALVIIYGLLCFGLVFTLMPYVKGKIPTVEELLIKNRALVFVLAGMLFIVSIEYMVMRAYVIGAILLIAVIIGITSYIMYVRSAKLGLMLGIAVMLTAIFTALSGFMGSIVLANIYLGVASIPIFIASAVCIMALSVEIRKPLKDSLTVISVLVFSVSLIVGSVLVLWSSIGRLGVGGAITAASALALVSGMAALISGILILVTSIVNISALMRAHK